MGVLTRGILSLIGSRLALVLGLHTSLLSSGLALSAILDSLVVGVLTRGILSLIGSRLALVLGLHTSLLSSGLALSAILDSLVVGVLTRGILSLIGSRLALVLGLHTSLLSSGLALSAILDSLVVGVLIRIRLRLTLRLIISRLLGCAFSAVLGLGLGLSVSRLAVSQHPGALLSTLFPRIFSRRVLLRVRLRLGVGLSVSRLLGRAFSALLGSLVVGVLTRGILSLSSNRLALTLGLGISRLLDWVLGAVLDIGLLGAVLSAALSPTLGLARRVRGLRVSVAPGARHAPRRQGGVNRRGAQARQPVEQIAVNRGIGRERGTQIRTVPGDGRLQRLVRGLRGAGMVCPTRLHHELQGIHEGLPRSA